MSEISRRYLPIKPAIALSFLDITKITLDYANIICGINALLDEMISDIYILLLLFINVKVESFRERHLSPRGYASTYNAYLSAKWPGASCCRRHCLIAGHLFQRQRSLDYLANIYK